ncbi:MAG: GxxExxY protein [Bacteroidales bacterium]
MDEAYLKYLSGQILDAAIAVHKEMGPGLLESVYEHCLCKEFKERNLNFKQQQALPLKYKEEELNKDFRIDILVEDLIIIEIKAVETLLPIHYAQILAYLKLSKKKLGLLINFNVVLLKDGFKRVVN